MKLTYVTPLMQENQVIDFLALGEDVQFIKSESCVPSPPADGSTDFGGDVDVGVMDTFDASPLLHEASKHVALTNLQENLANLPALHADENASEYTVVMNPRPLGMSPI